MYYAPWKQDAKSNCGSVRSSWWCFQHVPSFYFLIFMNQTKAAVSFLAQYRTKILILCLCLLWHTIQILGKVVWLINDWSMAVCNQGVPPFVHHYRTLEMPWNVLRNWFGDGSNFSLMAPKSYRGIVATPSHHHRITLNMFLHAARSLVLTFSYTLFIENDQERHVSNLCAPYVVQEHKSEYMHAVESDSVYCLLVNCGECHSPGASWFYRLYYGSKRLPRM